MPSADLVLQLKTYIAPQTFIATWRAESHLVTPR